jgi:hypothetical protein
MGFRYIRLMEHLAVDCSLSLLEFCDRMQRRFGLPEFELDFENETEWGLVIHEGIEYNVSRPYERGTLEEWDGSVPVGCNFGVTLTVSEECPPSQDAAWSSGELVQQIGQGLADLLGRRVYHHRSWVQGGENTVRKRVFLPRSRHAERTRRVD